MIERRADWSRVGVLDRGRPRDTLREGLRDAMFDLVVSGGGCVDWAFQEFTIESGTRRGKGGQEACEATPCEHVTR